MTVRYHYDAEGKYRGRSLSDADLALELVLLVLLVPAVLFFVLRWLYHGLLGYSKLAIPYKWFVGYYYFAVAMPYMWADRASRWVLKSTQWPNLNLALGTLVFFGMFVLPFAAVIYLLRRVPGGRRLLIAAAFGPLVLLVGWYLGTTIVEWLFSK